MITEIALYHSTDKTDEMYWDIAQTEEDFNIQIKDTGKINWGQQYVFEISGDVARLEKFAIEFCNAENLAEIEEA